MINQIQLMPISKLNFHEHVSPQKVDQVAADIKKRGYVKHPIIVDENYLVVLDGHHRVAALESLGAKKVPAFMIDYFSHAVRVYARNKNILERCLKNEVIRSGLNGSRLPVCSTRHLLKNRPRNINMGITDLF